MGTHPIFESDFDCLTGTDEEALRGFQLSRQTFGPPDEIEQKIIDTIIEIDQSSLKHESEQHSSSNSPSSTPPCSPGESAPPPFLNPIFIPTFASSSSTTEHLD